MEKKYLTIKEAAEYLGISASTMYKHSMSCIIPKYKPNGGRVYLKVEDLDNYISSSRIMSRQEVEDEAEKYIANSK